MGFFRSKEPTRSELLQKAGRARSKKRKKKAIILYKKLIEMNPDDLDVHTKIAPLLAATKDKKGASVSFEKAAKGYFEKGFADKAISVYKQAASSFPYEVDLWIRIARLYIERHKKQNAINILVEGSKNFRRKAQRPKAVKLLQAAFHISPWEPQVTLSLANAMAKSGRQEEARTMLTELAKGVQKKYLRTVRRKILFLAPSPSSLWQWLKAMVT